MMLSNLTSSPSNFLWKNIPMGVSKDANNIQHTIKNIERNHKTSSLNKIELRNLIRQEEIENCLNNFLKDLSGNLNDSEIAINTFAIQETEDILKSLPDEIPVPELMDEGNGFLTLEWCKNPKNIFVISLNGTKTIEYAWLYGSNKEDSGKRDLDNVVPDFLIKELKIFLQYEI